MVSYPCVVLCYGDWQHLRVETACSVEIPLFFLYYSCSFLYFYALGDILSCPDVCSYFFGIFIHL